MECVMLVWSTQNVAEWHWNEMQRNTPEKGTAYSSVIKVAVHLIPMFSNTPLDVAQYTL